MIVVGKAESNYGRCCYGNILHVFSERSARIVCILRLVFVNMHVPYQLN